MGGRRARGGFDVFISYRREGGAFAARLLFERLGRDGLRVFLDVDLLKSGRFDSKLLRQIQSATNFVLVLSEGSLERCRLRDDWLRREVSHAIHCGRNIIPILMPGFGWPKESRLPPDLRRLPSYNGIIYEHEHFDGVIEQLHQFLRIGPDRLA